MTFRTLTALTLLGLSQTAAATVVPFTIDLTEGGHISANGNISCGAHPDPLLYKYSLVLTAGDIAGMLAAPGPSTIEYTFFVNLGTNGNGSAEVDFKVETAFDQGSGAVVVNTKDVYNYVELGTAHSETIYGGMVIPSSWIATASPGDTILVRAKGDWDGSTGTCTPSDQVSALFSDPGIPGLLY